jgi:hypothetical protein
MFLGHLLQKMMNLFLNDHLFNYAGKNPYHFSNFPKYVADSANSDHFSLSCHSINLLLQYQLVFLSLAWLYSE